MTIAIGGGAGGFLPSFTGPGSAALSIKSAPYNAKVDGKFVYDATITSGQNTLHSVQAAFTSADVGKYVLVQGAGAAGADLLSTISSVAAGVATLANAASNTVASFGLVCYGSDDTSAVQAAINDAIAAGGGEVYNPGTSIIAGSLQTVVGGGYVYAAQIPIYYVPANKAGKGFLRLTGKFPMNWLNESISAPPQNGSMYVSMSPGATYATNSAIPSFFGGPDPSNAGDTGRMNIAVVAENLGFMMPTNPQLTALQMGGVNHFQGAGCWVGTPGFWTSSPPYAVQPTHPVGMGVLMPGASNYSNCSLRDFCIEGMYNGLQASEHTDATNVLIVRSYIGLSFHQPNTTHPARFGYLDIERCPYTIAGNDYTGSGLGNFPGGFTLSIDELDLESLTDGSWAQIVDHVYDPTNQLHGRIGYRDPSHALVMNGGTHLTMTNLGA